MEFLGVGPLEIIFILIIALIVLGPKDMVATGRTIGKFLRTLVKSQTWQTVQQTSREIRYLPNKLMREAGLEEQAEELKSIGKEVEELSKVKTSLTQDINRSGKEITQDLSAWTTPPKIENPTISSPPPPSLDSDNPPIIQPPDVSPPTPDVNDRNETES